MDSSETIVTLLNLGRQTCGRQGQRSVQRTDSPRAGPVGALTKDVEAMHAPSKALAAVR